MSVKWVLGVLLALIVGVAGGYELRTVTAPSGHTITLPNGRTITLPAGASGFAGFGRGFAGGFGAFGQVAAVSGNTLEVQGPAGEVTVKITPSTTITRTVKTSASSIAVGLCVTAVGPTNSIGVVSATRVSLSNPGPNGCTRSFGPSGG
jgi:hypothetical protein